MVERKLGMEIVDVDGNCGWEAITQQPPAPVDPWTRNLLGFNLFQPL